MKLLTKEILDAFKKQGDTSELHAEEIKVICKFFDPTSNATWWLYEYDPKDRIFFGFVLLNDPCFSESGTVSLDELESFKGSMGLGIERDMSYPVGKETLKEVVDKVQARA